MKLLPSASLVKRSLTGHSWVGLMVGVLMYLVCLSGTLAVFFEELERWEQPYVEEFADLDPATAEATFNEWMSDVDVTPHMYFVLPTESVPRARLATEDESWFVNRDGSIGTAERNDWTELLLNLHLYLHLPESWGMILVSALGAMLVALIVSGLVAHPRIFRDAFNFRPGGSRLLEQADIHNRLSVWGVPFHLMIAVTGAWFGLVLPFLAVYASAEHGGDSQAVVASVFGEEPQLRQPVGPLAIGEALRQMDEIAPEARPFMIVAHEVGEPGQFFAVPAVHPGRLIYAENYLFDASGNFLRSDGFADGAAGKQVIYSIYRLHFGRFGGLAVKVAYGILGLALTVVSVTGINVWLARRRTRDWLNDAWSGCVWGAPLALGLTAMTQIVFGLPSAGLFWAVMLAAILFCLWLRNAERGARLLQGMTAIAIAVLLATYALRFGSDALAPAALGVNVSLAVTACIFAWMARLTRTRGAADPALIGRRKSPALCATDEV